MADACRGARVGVLAGGRLLDEDAYALSKLARTVLRTNDLDHRRAPHGGVGRAALGRRRRRRGHVPRPRARRRDRRRRARRRAGGADPAPAAAQGRRARGADRGGAPRAGPGCTTSPSTCSCRPGDEAAALAAIGAGADDAGAGAALAGAGDRGDRPGRRAARRSTTAPRTPPSPPRERRRPVRVRHPARRRPRRAARPACTPRSARAADAWTTTGGARGARGRLGPRDDRGRSAATRSRSCAPRPSASSTSSIWSGSTRSATRPTRRSRAARCRTSAPSSCSRSSSATWSRTRRVFLPAASFLERDGHLSDWEGRSQRVAAAARRRRDQPARLGDLRGARGRRAAATSGSTRSTSCTRRWPVCWAPREVDRRRPRRAGARARPTGSTLVHLPAACRRGPDVRGRRRAARRRSASPPFAEMHPSDAAAHGLADGLGVRVAHGSRRGRRCRCA